LSQFDWERLKTLYIGGGTPSLWSSEGIEFVQYIKSDLNISPGEITLEVDPDTWNDKEIEQWLKVGVNRFSLGVQAYDDKVLSKLDRQHTISDVEKTLKYFNERDLNFSVDLLIGAPIKKRNITNELEKILEYKPKHLSVYILKTRANYPHKNEEPVDDYIANEYMKVSSLLKNNSYNHYEVSNYALPGYESQHNLSYWKLANVLAIGPNATGFYVEGEKARRYQVSAKTNKFVFEELSKEAFKLEKFYLALRTNLGVRPNKFINEDEWEKVYKSLKTWADEGAFIKLSYDQIILSSYGYLFIDSIIDDFFKHTSL
jgi:oxygen-independent coproporphyrinogen-3 oxidase